MTALLASRASRTLLFAGGGTGGHVFPLLSVADALRGLAPNVRVVFVGTARGMEVNAVPIRGYELELLDVLPLRGGGVMQAMTGLWRAGRAVLSARALVRRFEPAALLSVGGYAAGPVALAAWTFGVPLALLEPNSVMGLANRLVAPLATRAYVAFPETERQFRPGRVLCAGVPLRAGFGAAPYAPPPSPARLRLLVLGGSQGAKALNEVVPRAVARLRGSVTVVHQCGPAHADAVRALYAELDLADVRVTPFIDDMPRALVEADLVVARSGAGATSEICAVGRPSLLVPYPYAADDHQRYNADALVRAGAALCVDDRDATPERVAKELAELVADRALLARMADRARAAGRPEAARTVALDLLELAGLRTAEKSPESGRREPPDHPNLAYRTREVA